MSYSEHNYTQGSILYATQLNEMDHQIALNESQKGNKAIWVNMGTITGNGSSATTTTKTVQGVTTDMICASAYFGTPAAQKGNLTVNTDVANQVTVTGLISGSTTLYLLLIPKNNG